MVAAGRGPKRSRVNESSSAAKQGSRAEDPFPKRFKCPRPSSPPYWCFVVLMVNGGALDRVSGPRAAANAVYGHGEQSPDVRA